MITMKLFDFCVTSIAFYICGFGLSNLANSGIVGARKFFTIEFNKDDYLEWLRIYC
jgi:hypothetical protein